MFSIRGDVKDYDWGILDGLTPWTQDSSGAPQAELWFGVHPSGPSPIDAVVHEGETASPTENLADHLTREQKIAMDLVMYGRNVFITGGGGVGKSSTMVRAR